VSNYPRPREYPPDLWKGFSRFRTVVERAVEKARNGHLLNETEWVAFVWHETDLPTVPVGWSSEQGDWFTAQWWYGVSDICDLAKMWARSEKALLRRLVPLLEGERERQTAHNYLSGCPNGVEGDGRRIPPYRASRRVGEWADAGAGRDKTHSIQQGQVMAIGEGR